MKKLTVALLKEQTTSVYDTIEFAKTYYPKRPSRISKPILKSNFNSLEAFQYAEELEVYEKQLKTYVIEKTNYEIEQVDQKQSAYDNKSEKWQEGEKGEEASQVISNLEEARDEAESLLDKLIELYPED